jgi:hypothetical protein
MAPTRQATEAPEADDPLHRAWLEAERRLLAPGLLAMTPASLGATVREVVTEGGEGRLGRGVRRALRDLSPSALAAFDFEGWRTELRALAWAHVVDALDGDLRRVLCELLRELDATRVANDGEALDLLPWLTECPEAKALLRIVLRACLAGAPS